MSETNSTYWADDIVLAGRLVPGELYRTHASQGVRRLPAAVLNGTEWKLDSSVFTPVSSEQVVMYVAPAMVPQRAAVLLVGDTYVMIESWGLAPLDVDLPYPQTEETAANK